MAVDIHNLIAAISPDIFCVDKEYSPFGVKEIREEVKKTVKSKGYLEAAKIAKPVPSNVMNFDDIYFKTPFQKEGLKNPIEKHSLTYETTSKSLDQVYFWLLDTLQREYDKVDKLVDTFTGSAGSSFFAEMGARATKMQDEAMKMLGTANTVVKSIINIVYDLKEFKLRLELYDRLKKGTHEEKVSAKLSLKQIWIDTVDLKRGNTSIKAMSQQYDYVTIIDAFMAAESLEKIKELDLNDRVRRILQQRIGEFEKWVELSESELRKRYNIEKTYLRSQVNVIKLYGRWVKPYLRAAKKLEQNATETADLVTAFNTSLFELTLMGVGKYEVDEDVGKGELPKLFVTAPKRKYSPVGIFELKFRSIPERMQQGGYGFVGKATMTFTSYALNEDELDILKKEMAKDDIGDIFEIIETSTESSMNEIKKDIDEFLDEDKKKEEIKEESEDTNPITELFSFFTSIFKSEKKDEKKDLSKGVPKDSDIEKIVRSQAIISARKKCSGVYGGFKKANQMPSLPSPFPS